MREKLEKYENDSKRITSSVSVKNILELKEYYFHQQKTQNMLMQEIKDLEKEREAKIKKSEELSKMIKKQKLMKNGIFSL